MQRFSETMTNKNIRLLPLLFAVLLIFSSCGKEEPVILKTQDMLDITNNEENFKGCLSRMNSVVSALTNKVTVIEQQHNYEIELEDGEGYFLDKDYILNVFDPFNVSSITYTDVFDDTTTVEYVQDLYKNEAGSASVLFSNGKNEYSLKFVTEEYTRIYYGKYDKKSDSLYFTYSEEKTGETSITEFLEFVSLGNNSYLIQSIKSRCYISFDEIGNIVSFYCSELDTESYGENEMLLNSSEPVIDITAKKWATGKNADEYISIHTYEDGILKHRDSSSGTIKEVSIEAEKYASAFLR